MANVTRWDPWGEMLSLRQAMDRLFEDAFIRPRGGQEGWGGREMLGLETDCYERDDELVVTAALPGVKPENVDVAIQGNVLTIRGETSEESEQGEQEGRWHQRERRFGSYFRQIQLPVQVNAEQAEARFENGVLRLTLPKAEEARERRIQIATGIEEGRREIGAGAGAGSRQAARGAGGREGREGREAQAEGRGREGASRRGGRSR